MSQPRLLYLLHQFKHLTGVELHTQMLVDGLADRYDVWVAWPDGGLIRLLHGPDCERTFAADPCPWPVVPVSSPRTNRSLADILEWVRPDIIHVQHFLHWPLGMIDQAVGSGARVLVSFHDHFALSPQYALQGHETPEQTISPDYSRRMFGRDISAHLCERRELLRRSFAQAHALVTVSPYIERKLAAVFPADYRQIEYGIRPFEPFPKVPALSPLQETGLETRPTLRFGFLGQQVPMKGTEDLVRAFGEVHRRHPGTELHCYGGRRADPPPGVTFHDLYQPADLPGICAKLDVGVIPSVFAETYCMVLSEMWLGRLPVAVSDIGALADRVADGVNGKPEACAGSTLSVAPADAHASGLRLNEPVPPGGGPSGQCDPLHQRINEADGVSGAVSFDPTTPIYHLDTRT